MAARKTPAKTPRSATYVALLRGINVGGKHKLPMAALAELLSKLGCEAVRTYIQSGNAIFEATGDVAAAVPTLLPKSIGKRFGFEPPVVIRSARELADVAASSPFPFPQVGPDSLHVLFLSTRPTPSQIATLDPNRSPGDKFAVRGGEIYMYLTTGAADTKLTNAYFDSKLSTMGTGRNWRTVLKLVELTRTPP